MTASQPASQPASQRSVLEPVSGNTSETQPANNAYYPALDGLRAIAFLMVFALHYLHKYLPVSWGWAGVDVFFVLSGFLITGILFDSRNTPHHFRNFYIRRTLRIFPLYYAVFAVLLLLAPFLHWNWDWRWLLWPAYLGNFTYYLPHSPLPSAHFDLASGVLTSRTYALVQLNLGHFWSLCVEEQFYLIWPWIIFSIKDRKKLICICLAFIVICPALRSYADHFLPPYALNDALYFSTPFRFDALLFGALIALLQRGPSRRAMLIAARGGLVLLAGGALLLLTLAPHAFNVTPGLTYPLWRLSLKLSFADAVSACVLVMALEFGSPTFNLLSLPPLRWFGRITYGAYVFHDIPRVLFTRLLTPYFADPGLPVAALAFVVTLLLAWASFRWLESPFLRLKERWTT